MQRILKQIEEEINGELSTESDDIDYYSTDGSVFEVTPDAVVFPKDTLDVQAVVRILHEAAEQGTVIPVTGRGKGTDQSGGPLNKGIIIDFTKYMNHILEIGDDFVRVEPGVRYGELQAELKKRGKYIPAYPASVEICAIGGAVANNSAGEKTVKYGATRDYVESIKVVLSNGDLVTTYPMKGYEVGVKKREGTFESEIYKKLDQLLEQNKSYIKSQKPHVSKVSAGYALWEVEKYNKFDLGQLFVGSQGTLGLHTEITLSFKDVPDNISLMVSFFDDVHKAGSAVKELLHLKPSALEVVDLNLIEMVLEQDPALLKGLLPKQLPTIVLLTELDDNDLAEMNKKKKIAQRIFDRYSYESVEKSDPEEMARLWKLRRSAAAVMWTIPGKKKALPIIEDAVVHASLLTEFFERAYELFNKYDLDIAVWGHAGDGNLHMQPFLDLSKAEDRDKLFDLTDDFYAMISELGGCTSAEHNDGLMRSAYLPEIFDDEMMQLFAETKKIFDPHNILNPNKKVGVEKAYLKKHLRHEYSIKSIGDRKKARKKVDR